MFDTEFPNIESLYKRAKKYTSRILEYSDDILVVSHIDADGVTSAAIISKALKRENIEHDIYFVKSLDSDEIKKISDMNPSLTIFTDLGSSFTGDLSSIESEILILDHHEPVSKNSEFSFMHLNPHLFGLDGSKELSGSGTTFFLSKAMNKKNVKLADLAVVGAVGDLQDSRYGELEGVNRKILKLGEKVGVIKFDKDLKMFGKQTRPVSKLLEYSSNPYIPGITGNHRESIQILKDLEIPLKSNNKWRRWIDLDKTEKRKIISRLIHYCLSNGTSSKEAEQLIGEVYILTREEPGTELRDASEFSTLLNATARYERPDVGLEICLGDREDAYKEAKSLLRSHRKNLVKGISMVRNEGLNEMGKLQFFDAGDKIRDTVVGIVAGMVLQSDYAKRDLPIIGFANKNNEEIKVSARASQKLIDGGLNLGSAIRKASEDIGGNGGGHNIAAGATIPRKSKTEFLERLDKKIQEQIK